MRSRSTSHRQRSLAALVGAWFATTAMPALADPPDEGLRLYGGIGWAYDDNLLRVADDEAPFEGKRADAYRTAEAGVVYNKRISRQRVAVSAKASKVTFDHFDQLDYDGRDLQGSWHWEVGNRFEGRAEALHVQTLAPYTDFRSDQRNLRKQRRTLVDAGYKMHPSWKLRAGYSHDRFDYELLDQRYNNRTEKAAEAELLYTSRSGSATGLVLRRVKGTFPNRRPVAAGVLVDDFTQDELKVRANWLATGTTTLQALAGYVRREQPSFGAGKTSGVNGRITGLYTPRGKISYTAAAWREFAPIESTLVSYTLNRGASLGATWRPADKVQVDASAIHEQRDYNARQAFPGLTGLTDTTRSAELRAVWQARRKVQVTAGVAHQSRKGSPVLGKGRFDANVVQVSANVLF